MLASIQPASLNQNKTVLGIAHDSEKRGNVLADSFLPFDCRVGDTCEIGTHRVVYCTIKDALGEEELEALIYHREADHRIAG